MWRHGKVNVNGGLVDTSWKVVDSAVVAINLPKSPAPDVDAAIFIDGAEHVRENIMIEEFPDHVTVPLITRAEMDRRIKEAEDARAKAKAEYEGRPWPPMADDSAKTEAAVGKPRKG